MWRDVKAILERLDNIEKGLDRVTKSIEVPTDKQQKPKIPDGIVLRSLKTALEDILGFVDGQITEEFLSYKAHNIPRLDGEDLVRLGEFLKIRGMQMKIYSDGIVDFHPKL